MSSYFKSDKEINCEVAKRIKDLRISNKISQEEMSLKTGLSKHTISNIENGKSFTFDNLLKVMRALNIIDRIDVLIPETKENPYRLIKEKSKRQRVYNSKKKKSSDWKWGDEA